MYQQDKDNGNKSGNFFMKFMLLLFFFAAVYFAYKYYHPDFREILGKSASTERIDGTVNDTLELEGAACIVADEPIEATEAEIITGQEKEAVKVTAVEAAATTQSSSKESIEETTSAKAKKQEKVASSESSKEAAVIAQTESSTSSTTETKETVQSTESAKVSAAEEKIIEEPIQPVQKAETATIDNNKHLTFKGVSINGTLSQFVAKMEAAGFKRTNKSSNDAEKGQVKLVGDFAGYNNCSVFVSTQSQLDLVCKIRVEFPGKDNWDDLYRNYTNLKNLLTEKYGKPKSVIEKNAYNSDNSALKFTSIKIKGSTYKTTFGTNLGSIEISLKCDESYDDPYVCLEYFDAENMKAEKNLALSDL